MEWIFNLVKWYPPWCDVHSSQGALEYLSGLLTRSERWSAQRVDLFSASGERGASEAKWENRFLVQIGIGFGDVPLATSGVRATGVREYSLLAFVCPMPSSIRSSTLSLVQWTTAKQDSAARFSTHLQRKTNRASRVEFSSLFVRSFLEASVCSGDSSGQLRSTAETRSPSAHPKGCLGEIEERPPAEQILSVASDVFKSVSTSPCALFQTILQGELSRDHSVHWLRSSLQCE